MHLRLVVVVAALSWLGCPSPSASDGGDDGGTPLDPSDPWFSTEAVPTLAPVCVAGWCWEDPLPIGGAVMLAPGDGDDFWVFADTVLVHHLASTADAIDLAGTPQLSGGGGSNLWFSDQNVQKRFDGTTVTPVTLPPGLTGLNALQMSGPDNVWQAAGATLFQFDGSQWRSHHPLTFASDAMAFATTVAVSSPTDVWVVFNVYDGLLVDSGGLTVRAAHFDGTGWTEKPGPSSPSADAPTLVTFGGDDLWAASSGGVQHFDGERWQKVGSLSGRLLKNRDALWLISGTDVFFLQNGAWRPAPTAPERLDVVVPGPTRAELWALSGSGGFFLFRNGRWHALSQKLGVSYSAIANARLDGGSQPIALARDGNRDRVAARGDDGRWSLPEFPMLSAGRLVALQANAPDDAWALGYDAIHFDGTSWKPTSVTGLPDGPLGWLPYMLQQCSFDDRTGLAAGSGLFHFDGTAWKTEAIIGPAATNGVACTGPAAGEGWAFGRTDVSHRLDGSWSTDVSADAIQLGGNLTSSGAHQLTLWLGGRLLEWNGGRWAERPTNGARLEGNLLASDGTTLVFVDAQGQLVRVGPSMTSAPVATGVTQIASAIVLGPDDYLFGKTDFGVWRFTAGTLSPLVFSSPSGRTLGLAPVLLSPTLAFGVDTTGALWRFDGSAWSQLSTTQTGFALKAFAADDVWFADGWHYDGTAWSQTMLPGTTTDEHVTAISGVSSSQLWLVSDKGSIWSNRSGAMVKVPPPDDTPAELRQVVSTAADDVWFGGVTYACGTGRFISWHFDGTSLTPWRTPEMVTAVRHVDGLTVARGGRADCSRPPAQVVTTLWRRDVALGLWVEAPMLDEARLFPDQQPDTGPMAPIPLAWSVGFSPRYGLNAVNILRRP